MSNTHEITGDLIRYWEPQIRALHIAGYQGPDGAERSYIDLGNTLMFLPQIIAAAFYAGVAHGLAIKPAAIELTLTDAQLAALNLKPASHD